MKNFIKIIQTHIDEWKGRYIGILIISYVAYSMLIFFADNKDYSGGSQEIYFQVLFFTFIVVYFTYYFGYEEARKQFFRPGVDDLSVVRKYAAVIDMLSKINNPVRLTELLLPYSRDRIKKALLNRIESAELYIRVGSNSLADGEKEIAEYKKLLFILNNNYINEDEERWKNVNIGKTKK